MSRLPTSLRALTLALFVSTSGCDYFRNEVFDSAPPVPPVHPAHDLVVTEGKTTYNGTALPLHATLATWTRVLGEPSRQTWNGATWDTLGITAALTRPPAGQSGDIVVDSFDVYFEPYHDVNAWEPEHEFPGRVVVDGAAFYRGVKTKYVNEQLRSSCKPPGGGARFGRSGLPGHYECFADGYAYWLRVLDRPRTDAVLHLQVSVKNRTSDGAAPAGSSP